MQLGPTAPEAPRENWYGVSLFNSFWLSQVFKRQLLKPQMEVGASRRLLAALMFNFSRTQVCWLKEFSVCVSGSEQRWIFKLHCLCWLLWSGLCGLRVLPPQTVCCFYMCVCVCVCWDGWGPAGPSVNTCKRQKKEKSSFRSRHTSQAPWLLFLQPHMTGIPENTPRVPWDLIR